MIRLSKYKSCLCCGCLTPKRQNGKKAPDLCYNCRKYHKKLKKEKEDER